MSDCKPLSSLGETRVDLLHLLEDLRDAYPGSIEETILTEFVANSIDASIRVATSPAEIWITPCRLSKRRRKRLDL